MITINQVENGFIIAFGYMASYGRAEKRYIAKTENEVDAIVTELLKIKPT